MSSEIAGSVTGTAAGVPFVALPPPGGPRRDAPLVLAWHLLDAPRTEAAFAAAIPLDGLDAWRVYLGLPLTGARLPEGGPEAFMALAMQDAVLNLYRPQIEQALGELPAALAALREQLGIAETPLGVMGGSAGAAVAQLVIAETDLDVGAAVLLSPVVQLREAIAAGGREFGIEYRWTPEADAVADRVDFLARSGDLGATPVLLVTGDEDAEEFRAPAAALAERLGDRSELVTIPGMGHALAEEPGIEPAPQTEHARIADGHAAAWFRKNL